MVLYTSEPSPVVILRMWAPHWAPHSCLVQTKNAFPLTPGSFHLLFGFEPTSAVYLKLHDLGKLLTVLVTFSSL
jgi:hypothetical protein